MKRFNESVISEYISKDEIVELATIYLPDSENDGEFDSYMSETAYELVAQMECDLDVDDIFYDTYPTKLVEEFLDEQYPNTGLEYLQEAIVDYLEDVYQKAVDYS